MRIDVHAHYYPPAYLEVLERAYAHPTTPREIGVRRILDGKIRPTPAMSRLDDRLAEMDRFGVDMQVLSVSIPQAYHADRATAVAMAQAANDGTAEACRRYPARFKGFASLPLPHVDAALDELARAIDQLGLHGVVLGGNVLQEPLDKPEFAPLFPAINLCHAGGYLPFQWERLNASYYTRPEARARISRPPTEYLKRFFYDNANFHVPALRCALETVGASQLMLGSDYPFGLGDIGKMVSSFEALGLGPEDRARVESGNALSVLR